MNQSGCLKATSIYKMLRVVLCHSVRLRDVEKGRVPGKEELRWGEAQGEASPESCILDKIATT